MQKKESRISNFFKLLKTVGTVVSFLITIFLVLIFGIFFLSLFAILFSPDVETGTGNIAVIPISGIITSSGDSDAFFSPDIANSGRIAKLIKKAEENSNIQAIIFEINSPGGSPVASDEIASEIKKSKKPTVAVIRETGTSGAFWVATAADTIFANRMSITGSIGVLASRLEFAGLLENYNITYRRIVSGRYKDAGSRFKEMTNEELELFQKTIDQIHEYFIEEVAVNRNLDKAKVRQIAHGFIFLGAEAKELGLIDKIGGKEEAVEYLENKLGIKAELAEYKPRKTLLDMFGRVSETSFYFMGRGIGSVLVEPKANEQFQVWT